ncbi:MAG: hypothetical protein JRJ87_26260 [Deltaproteobacteria bacterium]|nr:hypothetical protein [Deltaproteobacteria bacterium]
MKKMLVSRWAVTPRAVIPACFRPGPILRRLGPGLKHAGMTVFFFDGFDSFDGMKG